MSGHGGYPRDPDVITVYLGQFTWEHANQIAGELERAGIVWWYKEPGAISRIWERDIRLFVDRTCLEEARAISARILATPPRPTP